MLSDSPVLKDAPVQHADVDVKIPPTENMTKMQSTDRTRRTRGEVADMYRSNYSVEVHIISLDIEHQPTMNHTPRVPPCACLEAKLFVHKVVFAPDVVSLFVFMLQVQVTLFVINQHTDMSFIQH